jgi:hypothetical protein
LTLLLLLLLADKPVLIPGHHRPQAKVSTSGHGQLLLNIFFEQLL